ncbi:MAG TPA: outer membrane beta-barrel protein, partial [Segetibacter sp.]
QQGVAKTYAGGLNYNNKWGKNTDINASYIFNDQSLQTNRETNRQNIIPGNNFNYIQRSNSTRENMQHRMNISIDHKIDSFNSLKLTSAATLQKSNSKSLSEYVSENSPGKRLNSGYTSTLNDAHGMNLRNSLLYRHRFAKKGRTFSANFNLNYNESEGDNDLKSENIFYDLTGNAIQGRPLNQNIIQDAINRSYGGSVTYTEPTWKGGLAELTYFYNENIGRSLKNTYDFNNTSGKHDLVNDTLSNNFQSNYNYTGGSLNFRTQRKKWTTGFGATLQNATMESVVNKNLNIAQQFTDLLPNSNISYKISSYRTLRLDYTTNTRQPSVTQLQPVPDISDPLNIRLGNPGLMREYSHSVNVNYFASDPVTRRNFMMFAAINATKNAIVSSDVIDPATGIRTTRPVNADGPFSAFSSINTGFPIKKLKSRIDLGTSINYFKNVSFLNNNQNNIGNLSFTPNITWSFGIDNKVDIQATARVGYNQARYSLQKQLNTNYWQQQYGIEMTNYLPGGIVLNNNFNYTKTTGRAPGYNTSVPFWNASVAKGFLKNKRAEVKLSGFDLLKENIGITRNANQNYIEDIRYNVLQRYFLLSFTYSINKSGLNTGPRTVIRSF